MAVSRVRKSPARRPVDSRMTHEPFALRPSKKNGAAAVGSWLGKSTLATKCRDMTDLLAIDAGKVFIAAYRFE
jgi:hypothetical protein